MSELIKIDTIQELYRVDNKYWKTGDTDILPKRTEVAQSIDKRFWSEVSGIAHIVTQKHYPVAKLAEVLRMLGYNVEGGKNE